MEKGLKIITALVLTLVLCGCSIQDKIDEYASDKEQCTLNKENISQFSYKNQDYTILEDTISRDEVGKWVGTIRQLAIIDESGKLLFQEKIDIDIISSLNRISDQVSKNAYIVPFLNVYTPLNDEAYLIVEINDEYHKALANNNLKETDQVFKAISAKYHLNETFTINPENATQLLYGNEVYQVTSTIVSNDELGNYIDVLAKSIIFDNETKQILSKEDLNKIDWYGKNNSKRTHWVYTDVYEIKGMDLNEAVAVKINNQYYVTKKM